MGDIWDLVFLSEIMGPGVLERPDKKRQNTGSKVLEFAGRNGKLKFVFLCGFNFQGIKGGI